MIIINLLLLYVYLQINNSQHQINSYNKSQFNTYIAIIYTLNHILPVLI